MKIEPLSSGGLRIWMTDEELCRWGLRLEEMTAGAPQTNRAVRRLLGVARERMPFRSNSSVLVEAVPLEGGCLFLFSAANLLTSTTALPQIFFLPSAEAVLQLGEKLSAEQYDHLPPASLYHRGDGYALIVYMGIGVKDDCRRVLQEYGCRAGEGYVLAAHTEEHGRPITVGDALQRLCAAYESPRPTPPHPPR